MKNLNSKEEKVMALAEAGFHVGDPDAISAEGRFSALVVDDLFHTGASMEAAIRALKSHTKIAQVYVATLTWSD